MLRALLFWVGLLVFGALLGPRSDTLPGRATFGPDARMRTAPVALDSSPARRTRVGALTYLGGIRLTGSGPAFGGFSAVAVQGDRITLLSDGGNLVRFRLGRDWQPREAMFGELPAGPRTGWGKGDRDSESLAVDSRTGKMLVGFENANAIWRYDAAFARYEAHAEPQAMRGWPDNGGPEAMAFLPDGRLAVISEASRPRGMAETREGLIFAGDPTRSATPPLRFAYVPPAGYDPSDMAALPDGRLLVLNRRLSWPALFTARLVLIDPRGAKSGAVLRGPEIAAFAAPLLHDNFEGIAVTREGADTIVWLVSDDNQQFWEQSLLLKFRLEYGAETGKNAKSPLSAGRTGSR